MKKSLLVLPLGVLLFTACGEGGEESEDNALDNLAPESNEAFEEQAASFADGGAADANQYFRGLLAEVIEVDVKLQEITSLDEMDAPAGDFQASIDSCTARIDRARVAIDVYKDNDEWPLRGEFHDLTVEWLATVEGLCVNHLPGLAEAMSKPMGEISSDEEDLYNAYYEAVDGYLEVDNRWVEFQYTFADANGFELDRNNTIDMDALVEEDLESSGH